MTNRRFSPCLENIRMSPIVTISEEARRRRIHFEKKGMTFIPFQRGEIDLPTPGFIVEAAYQGMKKGMTKYPKSGGEDFFKEAILTSLERDYDIHDLDPGHVVVTYGGQEALELAFKLFSSGAGFSPCWSCALENFVPYADIDFTLIPLKKDFTVDYDQLGKKLEGKDFFYLNNPHNPTGKVFSPAELERIVEVCTSLGAFVIADEAYEKITYDGLQHHTLAAVPQENIVTVFTFSKTFSMTGWRVGYAVTRNERVARLLKLGNYTQTAGVPTFLQYAAAQALASRDEAERVIENRKREFQCRRDALYQGLASIDRIDVTKPQGAFYIFPDFSRVIPHDCEGPERSRYVYELLMENGIACVYGSCFGDHFEAHVRLSFSATPVAMIAEAVERMQVLFS